MSNKFTLIIPTRERCDTLQKTLTVVTKSQYENLTILVSDNFSQDRTRDVVMSFNDKRITYFNTGKRLSMSANYNFALSKVSEGWVSVIGDDDGFIPTAISEMMSLADYYMVDAVSCNYADFFWAGVEDNKSGLLYIPENEPNIILNSNNELQKVLSGNPSRINFPYYLPCLYHGGAVKIEVVNKITEKCGKFILSPIPDVYSSVVLSKIVGNYLRIGKPIFCSGNSKHSTGVSQFRLYSNTKQASPYMNFLLENDLEMLEEYPFTKSELTTVYEAFMKSKNLDSDLIIPNYESQLSNIIKLSGKNILKVLIEMLLIMRYDNSYYLEANLKGLLNWFNYNTKKKLKKVIYSNVKKVRSESLIDIVDAINSLDKILVDSKT